MRIKSGPPSPDLPYRWGCACGAVWNTDKPFQPTGALCGPRCRPQITPILPALKVDASESEEK